MSEMSQREYWEEVAEQLPGLGEKLIKKKCIITSVTTGYFTAPNPGLSRVRRNLVCTTGMLFDVSKPE